MDVNQDEYLLSCYRQWARDAGVSEIIIEVTEKAAREDYAIFKDWSVADKFHALIRHAVAPDSPWKGHA